MKKPLISVIIPTYNRSNTIHRAIKSVINQTYKNWELIIVDDGSIDSTHELIKNLVDRQKIKYFFKKNGGVSSARNFGLKKTRGDYICFLDSDDEYLKDKLEYSISEMEKYNLDISLSNPIKKKDDRIKIAKDKKSFYITQNDIINNKISISGSLMMFKRKVIKKLSFDERLKVTDDLDFILRSIKDFRIMFLGKKSVIINQTLKGNRISANHEKKIMNNQIMLDKINRNSYNLSKQEKRELLKRIYFSTAISFLIGSQANEGRRYLARGLRISSFYEKIKYGLLYWISGSSLLLKFVIATSKFLWRFNIIKT